MQMQIRATADEGVRDLQFWGEAHLSSQPAERLAAEEGVRATYAAAGLAPPSIIWCGGPVEIADQLAASRSGASIGINVKADVFDYVRKKVATLVEIFAKEFITAATDLTSTNPAVAGNKLRRYRNLSAAINRVVDRAATDRLSPVYIRARHALLRVRGGPRLLPKDRFAEAAIGPHEFALLSPYRRLSGVAGFGELTEPLQGLWAIGKSAGWIVPHERVCWISERPSRIEADANGRLHSPDGPALKYRDGWEVYVWKDVEVPAWMIENPERITVSEIDIAFDAAVRNAMIDIMTPERFIRSGGARQISKDETGTLWCKHWSYRGSIIGTWAAVEVVNGTAAADGSHIHYFLRVPARMRSAREAVAWTYGLSAEQYKGLKVRT